MPNRVILLAAAVVILTAPAAARADVYVGPGIGVAFGNPSARGLADFVLDACWLYQEPIGLELDTTFAPSFFTNQGPYGANSVTTVMANVVVAARETGPRLPRGLHRGRTARPYISGGLGLIREHTTAPAISRNDLGTNLGVGVLATTATQIGIRADLRYFRDLVGSSQGNTTGIDFGSFHFWRASITILFRF
jgi:Outer membrane protein beta-barrel domain